MNFSFRISWKSGWAKSRRQENRNTRTEAGNEAKRLPEVEKVEIELLLADGTRRYQCDPKAMRNRAELPWELTANQEKFVTYEMFQFHKLREIFSQSSDKHLSSSLAPAKWTILKSLARQEEPSLLPRGVEKSRQPRDTVANLVFSSLDIGWGKNRSLQ